MGDIKPIGSEKLEGMDKLRRIMEIAKYNEVPKQEINNLSTTNYTIRLADGNLYGIVKEKSGYIIKKGMNESNLDYSEPMRGRKHYRSYSEAMKRLNLVVAEVNRVTGNVFETPLIGEQEVKKKFILKTNKPKPPVEAPEPEPSLPPAPELPAAGSDMGMPPADGSDMGMPPADGSDMGMPPADDMGMPPADDMGMPPEDGSDMGMPPEDGSDMGDEELDMGDEQSQGPSGLKSIQRLTGKLSQKIRAFDKDKGLDSQDIKYVINSIISSIDLDNLDEDDKDDILSKFEDSDEYGMGDEGDLDLSDEEDMGEPMGEPMAEPMAEPMGEPSPMENFKESVEDVLANYFVFTGEEKKLNEEKNKKNFIKNKLVGIEVRNEIKKMCESYKQMDSANRFLNENKSAKFIGKTNKKNLVFSVNGKTIKVNTMGNII
jgi:hypothetical protein